MRVGLTGSIAVGKSFVSSVLAELGCHLLDADQTAREMVAPGSAGLRAVVEAFGAGVLGGDGALDRARLGAIVFADGAKRQLLNSILHPLIMAAQEEWIIERGREDPRGVAVVDAALMIETGSYRRFDKLIVVHCDEAVQLARLMKRDRLAREEAERRIVAQMPQRDKMRHADYLVDTSGTYDETRGQVMKIYGELRELARGPAA